MSPLCQRTQGILYTPIYIPNGFLFSSISSSWEPCNLFLNLSFPSLPSTRPPFLSLLSSMTISHLSFTMHQRIMKLRGNKDLLSFHPLSLPSILLSFLSSFFSSFVSSVIRTILSLFYMSGICWILETQTEKKP